MGHHSSAKYPDIVRDPEVQGGDPSIIGTRIPVWVIVAAWRINPRMADRCRWYPMLTPDLIEEALAFADENRQEIEAALRANDVELACWPRPSRPPFDTTPADSIDVRVSSRARELLRSALSSLGGPRHHRRECIPLYWNRRYLKAADFAAHYTALHPGTWITESNVRAYRDAGLLEPRVRAADVGDVEDRYGAWQVHQLHRVETNLPRYFERCLLLSHIPAEQRAKIEQWLLSPGVPFLTLEEWIPGFEALFEYMEYDGYLHRDAEPRLGVGELHSRTG